jgi:hypothetical protein
MVVVAAVAVEVGAVVAGAVGPGSVVEARGAVVRGGGLVVGGGGGTIPGRGTIATWVVGVSGTIASDGTLPPANAPTTTTDMATPMITLRRRLCDDVRVTPAIATSSNQRAADRPSDRRHASRQRPSLAPNRAPCHPNTSRMYAPGAIDRSG